MELPPGLDFCSGKVRDIFDLDDELLIVSTDRTSAFDQILGEAPYKGEVLNRVSAFWFNNTADIVPNHFVALVSPRSMLVKKCKVVPVEVVVRGYLTGSAWQDYLSGQSVSGLDLPDDLCMNERLDPPILTPSTKDGDGMHDRTVSRDEVIYSGVVEPQVWEQIEETALSLFSRGAEIAERQGLILVDTKYEFGLRDGELLLVDELHTPDSSRYWFADTYEESLANGESPHQLDKEYLRQWLVSNGYSGDGPPPVIPEEVFLEISRRYQQAFEILTGSEFRTQTSTGEAEKEKLLSFIEERQEEN